MWGWTFHSDHLSTLARWLSLAIMLLLALHGTSWGMNLDNGLGPLPVRNYQAIQLLFLEMEATSPQVLAPGEIGLDLQLAESNTIFEEKRPEANITMKLEVLRTTFRARYGLLPRLEIGLAIPIIYRYPGFLDGFIEDVEQSLKRLNTRRITFAQTPFVYKVDVRGETLLEANSRTLGLSDISLHVKGLVLTESGWVPMLALRFALKLPTGNRAAAFGSGRPEIGLGFAAGKHFILSLVGYLNGSVVFSQGRFRAPGLSLRPAILAMAGIEWRIRRNFSAHVQFSRNTSPFEGSGLRPLDNGVSEFTVGISLATNSHFVWHLYIIENMNKPFGAAADFSFGLAMSWIL